MEEEEQQNHQCQEHQTGDHENPDRDHQPEQIPGKDTDPNPCKEPEHFTPLLPISGSFSSGAHPGYATRQSHPG